MNEFEVLLQNIKSIKEKYNELNRKNAYEFNLFTLMLKASDEVNLHSKFIAELLNPQGSHHQGRLFLELFLEEVKLKIPNDRVDIYREKYNIDILLEFTEYAVILENKIYTKDHSSQLSRYLKKIEFIGYKQSNISLLYLTLFGEKPIEKNIRDRAICISYKKEICSWIERSIEMVTDIPVLYGSLLQYLYLIQSLTNQSHQKGFLMEIKELLLKNDNLKHIIEIEEAVSEAKIEVQLNFWQTLLANLFPYYAFTFYNTNNSNQNLEETIRRYYRLQKNVKDYGIVYQIDREVSFFVELRNNIYYGFEIIDEENISNRQKRALDNLDVTWNEISDTVYWKYSNKRLDFRKFNHQNIFDLLNENQRQKDIKIISDEVIDLISNYQKGVKNV